MYVVIGCVLYFTAVEVFIYMSMCSVLLLVFVLLECSVILWCFEDFAKIFAFYILRGMGVFEFKVLIFYVFSLCALISVGVYCS